jgi:hypothetical protein
MELGDRKIYVLSGFLCASIMPLRIVREKRLLLLSCLSARGQLGICVIVISIYYGRLSASRGTPFLSMQLFIHYYKCVNYLLPSLMPVKYYCSNKHCWIIYNGSWRISHAFHILQTRCSGYLRKIDQHNPELMDVRRIVCGLKQD